MKTPEEIMLQVMTYGLASNGFDGNKWTQCEDEQCSWTEDHWKPAVSSVLDALDAAGYVIVPKKATKEMCEAAYWVEGCIGPFGSKTDAAHVWETMIAAFQTQETRQSED